MLITCLILAFLIGMYLSIKPSSRDKKLHTFQSTLLDKGGRFISLKSLTADLNSELSLNYRQYGWIQYEYLWENIFSHQYSCFIPSQQLLSTIALNNDKGRSTDQSNFLSSQLLLEKSCHQTLFSVPAVIACRVNYRGIRFVIDQNELLLLLNNLYWRCLPWE